MNLLRRTTKIIGAQYLSNSVNLSKSFLVEKLNTRGLIRLQGAELIPFLQGLITNDMSHLTQRSRSMYTMFLNKAGKVLYDSIVYKTSQNDTYLIECDKEIIGDLEKHLKLFRVRRKIDIESVSLDYNIWVVFRNKSSISAQDGDFESQEGSIALKETKEGMEESPFPHLKDIAEECVICNDPRLSDLGTRVIVPVNLTISDINNLFPKVVLQYSDTSNDYKLLRYQLGIAEGIKELPPAKCFPLESNCDYLHGVSFHKGCYLGQEFTARTFHTGVIRKRLMPFYTTEKVDESSENIEMPNRKVVGKIRGLKDKHGIALIRIEQAFEAVSLYINSVTTKILQPNWWPKELPSKSSVKQKQI